MQRGARAAAHAIRLAEEGADIIAIDIGHKASPYLRYPAATMEDLAETVRQVESLDRQILAREVDVRNRAEMQQVVTDGVAAFGGLDIVVANAGICNYSRFWEMPEEQWQNVIDVNLTGVFHTLSVSAPILIEQGRGGSIIVTSSVAGLKALPASSHYCAAKHGVVGLTNTAALELGPYAIRVNSIHPWAVDTLMITDSSARDIVAKYPAYEAAMGQILFTPNVSSPQDIANSVLFLASDESRTITGAQFTIDQGATKT